MTFQEFDDTCNAYFPDGYMICNEKYPKFWRLPPGETHELRFNSYTRFMGKPTTMIIRLIKVGDQIICMNGCMVIEVFDTMDRLECALKSLSSVDTVQVFDAAMTSDTG